MFSLQQNNNNNNNKHLQLLQSNMSPTFRKKRIPSAHDNFTYSSNQNLKITKQDSPSKPIEKLKRRKSQYIQTSFGCHQNVNVKEKNQNNTNNNNNNNMIRKKQSKSINYLNSNSVLNCNSQSSNMSNMNFTNSKQNSNNSNNNINNSLINRSAPNIIKTLIGNEKTGNTMKSSCFINITSPQNMHNSINTEGSSNCSNINNLSNNYNNTNYHVNQSNIIQEMNCLKNEYKQLKLAYQELIEQKINNSQQMHKIKTDNLKLQAQLQLALMKINNNNNINNNNHPDMKNTKENSKLTQSIKSPKSIQQKTTLINNSQIEAVREENKKLMELNRQQQMQLERTKQQLERIKKECYKLLEGEKFKSQKLQSLIEQKDITINSLLAKMNKTTNNNHLTVVNRDQDICSKQQDNQLTEQESYQINLNNALSSLQSQSSNRLFCFNNKQSQQPLIQSTPKLASNKKPLLTQSNLNNKQNQLCQRQGILVGKKNGIGNKEEEEESLFISQDVGQEDSYIGEDQCKAKEQFELASNRNRNNFRHDNDSSLIYQNSNVHCDSINNISNNLYTNQSQFISISLTSVMDNSITIPIQDDHQRQQQIKTKDSNNNHSNTNTIKQLNNINVKDNLVIYQTQSTQTVMNLNQNILTVHNNNNNNINVSSNNINNKNLKFNKDQQDNVVHLTNKQSSSKRDKNQNKQKEKQREKQNVSKKTRKQITQKLQLNNLNQIDKNFPLLSLKTPINNDKKSTTKHKNSKSKKKQQEKQNYPMYHPKEAPESINRNMKKANKQKSHSLYHK